MFQELCGLLFSVLFDPLRIRTVFFPQEGFEQEKRQLLELKDAEFNDKIVYAHQRCEEILFEGQPAGVNRHGSREEIASLNREELSGAWQELLQNSRFEVFVLGDCGTEPGIIPGTFFRHWKPFRLTICHLRRLLPSKGGRGDAVGTIQAVYGIPCGFPARGTASVSADERCVWRYAQFQAVPECQGKQSCVITVLLRWIPAAARSMWRAA